MPTRPFLVAKRGATVLTAILRVPTNYADSAKTDEGGLLMAFAIPSMTDDSRNALSAAFGEDLEIFSGKRAAIIIFPGDCDLNYCVEVLRGLGYEVTVETMPHDQVEADLYKEIGEQN